MSEDNEKRGPKGRSKPFGKIYKRIYESSVAENWKAMVTLQQLIILADWDGVVDMTISAICRITNMPRNIIEEGIRLLELPDPQSRTPAEQGKRIIRLDQHRAWGWKVVNIQLYFDNADEKRVYQRQYMRDYRKRGKKGDSDPGPENGQNDDMFHVEPASDNTLPVDPNIQEEQRFLFTRRCKIPDNFCVTPRVRRWCEKNQHKPDPEIFLQRFVSHFSAKGTQWLDWDQTFINYIREELPGGKFHNSKHYEQTTGKQGEKAQPTGKLHRAMKVLENANSSVSDGQPAISKNAGTST